MASPARVKAEKRVTAVDLEIALRERHNPREWAFFAQVRNGTGYSRNVTRTADALTLGLWPSRGMELHGFEIKVARNDWLREGDDPEKAEEIAAYCNRWWIVAAEGVVADGELPPAWGLLVYRDGALVTVKEAPPREEAKPLDRSMVAAIMRSAAKADEAAIKARVDAEVERAIGRERKSHEEELERWKAQANDAWAAQHKAETTLRAINPEHNRYRMEALKSTAERIVADMTALLGLPSASPAADVDGAE